MGVPFGDGRPDPDERPSDLCTGNPQIVCGGEDERPHDNPIMLAPRNQEERLVEDAVHRDEYEAGQQKLGSHFRSEEDSQQQGLV